MKVCFKCHTEKSLDEYYAHKEMADGHLNKCKDCTKRDVKVGTVPRVCLECDKEFMAHASEIKRRGGGANTCSRGCYYKRLRKLLATKFEHKTSYSTIHNWVYKQGGKASKCEMCKVKGKKYYHWSNKSGEYKQSMDDWWQLCAKCHHAYDDIGNKVWVTRKKRYSNGFKKSDTLLGEYNGTEN